MSLVDDAHPCHGCAGGDRPEQELERQQVVGVNGVGKTTTIGKTAGITAGGNLALDAKKDITNLGADMGAGGDAMEGLGDAFDGFGD